ncbi:hypothetical protein GF382_03080 [Candidatus Falkowbacteria bacterium]|nr:hypothetical protein [Candidatus Falkowbacteria bacterium]
MPRKKRKKKNKKNNFNSELIPKILMFGFIVIAVVQTISSFSLASSPEYVHAQGEIDLNVPIGDEYAVAKFNQTTEPIAKYIQAIYKYATGAVGILAAVVLMWGGVIWVTAGDSTRVSEAKAWIGASITGLVLVVGSYVILSQVNPNLVAFQPKSIPAVKTISSPEKKIICHWEEIKNGESNMCDDQLGKGWANTTRTECTKEKPEKKEDTLTYECCCVTNTPGCPEDLLPDACLPCKDCKSLNPIITRNGDQAESSLVSKLLDADSSIKKINSETLAEKAMTIENIAVTEAWPPTVRHQSECHYIGACVDVNLDNRSTNPEEVAKVFHVLTSKGLRPVYECKISGCCNSYKNVEIKYTNGNPAKTVTVTCLEISEITAWHFSVYNN